MRLIGNVENKTHAERISAFLMTKDISSHCELEDEVWQIWVRDEDFLEQAKTNLEEFKKNPEAPVYRQAVDEAQRIAREQEKKRQEAKANYVQMTSDRWNAPITKVAPLTVALIAVSVVVSLFITGLGNSGAPEKASFRALSVTSISHDEATERFGQDQLDPYSTPLRLASITKGEVWRSITPVFLHFHVFHLLFNMYWLAYFGKQVEYRKGTRWLAILVIMIAIPSNLAGCFVPESLDGTAISLVGRNWTVLAGGMSGVIYGLFGYVWMKMIFEPKSGMFVSMFTAALLLVWLVACMAPDFPINVGNWAHGIGLASGLIIGYFPKVMSDIGIGSRNKPE